MTAKTETVVETVKMSDGRIVDFPGKRKLDKTSFIDAAGTVSIRLDFRNGETRMFVISDDLKSKFAAHGGEQKLGDETAGLDEVDDCVLAVDELIERLNNGEWSMKRESSGMSGTSVLLRAIVEVTGKPIDKIKEYLKGKTHTEKLALRESARFSAAVKRLEAEKESKRQKIDVAPLEAELDSIPDAA